MEQQIVNHASFFPPKRKNMSNNIQTITTGQTPYPAIHSYELYNYNPFIFYLIYLYYVKKKPKSKKNN